MIQYQLELTLKEYKDYNNVIFNILYVCLILN